MTNTKIQAGVQTAPAPWPTLTVAELAAHPGNVRDIEAPADLLADVKGDGVQEPLYVVRTHGEVPQIIDGFQRLAAAVAAGLETVPVTPRPVIRIDALTPHPKNAREDLDLNAPFVESLRAEGCRIPVKIQRLDGGTLQVNDGNRRYHAATDAGLTHLPYEWEDDDRDEAGQFLDMITTAQHRKSLTTAEMNQAMFSAAEAGAQVGRIAKAAGVRQKDVRVVVKVRSDENLRTAVTAASSYAWTFEHLAALTEFADDPEALAAITEAAAEDDADAGDVDWAIAIERTKRDKRAKAEAHRTELETAGQKIRDTEELSERAMPVWRLRGISTQEHAECKGQVWVFDEGRGDRYEPYCSAPGLYGHTVPEGSRGSGGTKTAAEVEAERAARAAVKKGNIDWDAAEAVRRKWITDLIKRRNLSKDIVNTLIGHVNNALLNGSWGLSDDLNKEPTTEILASFLGLTSEQAKDRGNFAGHVAKDPRRAPQLQFAALAAVREKCTTRAAWRTGDQHSSWVRKPASRWFKILESLGYPLTPIEQSVMDEEPYDPAAKKKPRAAITSGSETEVEQEPGTDEESSEPEAEEADEPSSDDEAAA
ncbi:ParB/RepB/Spo0J family partition protein [Streptomyces scabiei]|uniref:ParB/RepB/Spo0J family partition protein n=1 Tax=Streptomyces scabiei TaxID=1930 RepID=UPI0029B294B4|nr:ParB N-terminal domain-containing protein [Streptomyces scabiei]MDX2538829.1 ParB N-terminal domain-containing protein [Streptomyces scabiei]MDX2802625.1 ParB N-terminal domain-containing protein [Streptomyces scabiei]MDX2861778.1 ParB N-terminal domain-containing protein [Streptomyces scabiei]MDX3828987.1 ParB N-terminal domain-containing protein [Streptomyces scabiei]